MRGIVFSLLFRLRWPGFLNSMCCYEQIREECCARKFYLANELDIVLHRLFAARQRLAIGVSLLDANDTSYLACLPHSADGGGDLHACIAPLVECTIISRVWPHLTDTGAVADACTMRRADLLHYMKFLQWNSTSENEKLFAFYECVQRMVGDRLMYCTRIKTVKLTEAIYLDETRGITLPTLDTDTRYTALGKTLVQLEQNYPRSCRSSKCNCTRSHTAPGNKPFCNTWQDCLNSVL
jgi:hypothetical protein